MTVDGFHLRIHWRNGETSNVEFKSLDELVTYLYDLDFRDFERMNGSIILTPLFKELRNEG